jgi:hypothetical protein
MSLKFILLLIAGLVFVQAELPDLPGGQYLTTDDQIVNFPLHVKLRRAIELFASQPKVGLVEDVLIAANCTPLPDTMAPRDDSGTKDIHEDPVKEHVKHELHKRPDAPERILTFPFFAEYAADPAQNLPGNLAEFADGILGVSHNFEFTDAAQYCGEGYDFNWIDYIEVFGGPGFADPAQNGFFNARKVWAQAFGFDNYILTTFEFDFDGNERDMVIRDLYRPNRVYVHIHYVMNYTAGDVPAYYAEGCWRTPAPRSTTQTITAWQFKNSLQAIHFWNPATDYMTFPHRSIAKELLGDAIIYFIYDLQECPPDYPDCINEYNVGLPNLRAHPSA